MTVYVVTALDEDAQVKEQVVFRHYEQANRFFKRMCKSYGAEFVCLASRKVTA